MRTMGRGRGRAEAIRYARILRSRPSARHAWRPAGSGRGPHVPRETFVRRGPCALPRRLSTCRRRPGAAPAIAAATLPWRRQPRPRAPGPRHSQRGMRSPAALRPRTPGRNRTAARRPRRADRARPTDRRDVGRRPGADPGKDARRRRPSATGQRPQGRARLRIGRLSSGGGTTQRRARDPVRVSRRRLPVLFHVERPTRRDRSASATPRSAPRVGAAATRPPACATAHRRGQARGWRALGVCRIIRPPPSPRAGREAKVQLNHALSNAL
jgi:hypothetical protein